MALSVPQTAQLRNRLYPLDPDHQPEDQKKYEAARRNYLVAGENIRLEAYDDGTSCVTVGIGFNMKRPEARQEWTETFRNDPGEVTVDFDSIYQRKKQLSPTEVFRLFNDAMARRQKEIIRSMGKETWSHLTANERLALESIYYNKPGLLRLMKENVQSYVQAQEDLYLYRALLDIDKDKEIPRSPRIRNGIINRRCSEMEMMASYRIPGRPPKGLKIPILSQEARP